MNRAQRLQCAPSWLATQTGRTPVQTAKAYRKRHGVDWPCAVQELSLLGVNLDPGWVAQLYRSLEGAQRARRQRRESQEQAWDLDSDHYFAYIAGYTPGGAAFGITWEEWRQMEAEQSEDCM
jgi:hypothetical protein